MCEINDLGLVLQLDGIDEIQSQYFLKIHNETYINMILRDKKHLLEKRIFDIPIPIHNSQEFKQKREEYIPLDAVDHKQI